MYSPDDYDHKGQLRLPLIFWIILLLQARSWLLLIMAGASRDQGNTLLELFYPETSVFWIGMALGVPAAAGLLLTGYRQRLPRLWRAWRGVLCADLLAMLLQQGLTVWLGDEALSPLVLLFMLFDLLALGYLLFSQRLRDCFDVRLNSAE